MSWFNWSDEATLELRRLFDCGYSASQIGAEFGGTFGHHLTRSAVLGKLHRLGLKRGCPAPNPRPPRVQRPGIHRAKAWKSQAPVPFYEPAPAPPTTDEDTPMEQRRTLMELTDETCRWPIGDGKEMFFCGATADLHNGLPYCPHHTSMAYQSRGASRRPFIPMRNTAA